MDNAAAQYEGEREGTHCKTQEDKICIYNWKQQKEKMKKSTAWLLLKEAVLYLLG